MPQYSIVRRYDVQAFRPTVFAGVPRVYDRFKDGVEAKIKEKGGLAAKLFVAGLEKKIAVLQVRILKPMQRKAQPRRFGSGFGAALVLSLARERRSLRLCVGSERVLLLHLRQGLQEGRCGHRPRSLPHIRHRRSEPVESFRTTLLAPPPHRSPASPSPSPP